MPGLGEAGGQIGHVDSEQPAAQVRQGRPQPARITEKRRDFLRLPILIDVEKCYQHRPSRVRSLIERVTPGSPACIDVSLLNALKQSGNLACIDA
ncbi:hypothetical protein I0C86_12325 [Plantactinospora sp. S1510]|uniref:Uncharacterized protein n=1 Tax=Plantactinospora alkalitolerans TaxID=2789879 RepID=A0ABS0GU50_9ACTN|nr:hypothetical protein [Plantactinospora alkalitolerans]MBF9129738.1 hypothetical protein [Plantactinospora alkalitolerans]